MSDLTEGLNRLEKADGKRNDSAIILWEQAVAITAKIARMETCLRELLKETIENGDPFSGDDQERVRKIREALGDLGGDR